MRRALLGMMLLPLLLLSGCASPSPLHSASKQQAALGDDSPGRVVGTVQAALGLRLTAAEVVLEPPMLGTQTDDRGVFEFSELPAGDYRLRITKLGYREHVHELGVVPGGLTQVTITLAALQEPSAPSLETYVERGFIQCSANEAQSVNPCDPAGAEDAGATLLLDVDPQVKEFLFELVWESTTPTTGQELQIDVCGPSGGERCAGAVEQGAFHRSAAGPTPVVLSVLTEEVPDDLEQLGTWIGNGRGSPYPTVAQSFTLYLTVCYSAACPSGFTAIPA